MKIRTLILFLFLIFLVSCGGGGGGSSSNNGSSGGSPESQWHTSPKGFWVQISESVYANGLFLPEIIVKKASEIDLTLTTAVDMRIQEWCEKRGYDCNTVNAKFVLHDGFDFACSRSISDTGLCAGTYDGDTIEASIYAMWRGYGEPDFISPPHTWMTTEEREAIIGRESPYDYTFYAGKGEPLCPVISHELDEKYFGHKFAHAQ